MSRNILIIRIGPAFLDGPPVGCVAFILFLALSVPLCGSFLRTSLARSQHLQSLRLGHQLARVVIWTRIALGVLIPEAHRTASVGINRAVHFFGGGGVATVASPKIRPIFFRVKKIASLFCRRKNFVLTCDI
jgi:hypothetical protein